tara:strand:+ start:79205 stop:82783 length:3579 start_codon:yes stop_codon:yes gene_type:complete
MIIERLDLQAYGGFSDVSLDLSAEPHRFHLVYGPNESGKSTSLRAITSLLYGMSSRIEDAYIHPAAKLRVGAVLRDDRGNTIECLRRRGRVKTLRQANDKDVIDDSVLHDMLGGIDEETFRRQFGLSHEELVEGGSAILSGNGDLGAILFAAGAGIGRLKEIQSTLATESDQLFKPSGKNAALNQAIREFGEKNKKLKDLQVAPAEFKRLQSEFEAKRAVAAEMENSLTKTASDLNRLRAYRKAMPIAPKWKSIVAELQPLQDAPLLDAGFTERRRDLESQLALKTQTLANLEKRLADLSESLRGIAADDQIMSHASEIDELFQNLGAIRKARKDQVGLVRIRHEIERAMVETLRQLAIEIPDAHEETRNERIDASVGRLELTDATRSTINSMAQNYGVLIQQRDLAEQELATLKRKLDDVEEELRESGTPGDPQLLRDVLDAVGSPHTRIEAAQQQTELVNRFHRKADDLLQRLAGYEGTAAQAAKLSLPTTQQIERLSARLQSSDDALAAARSKLEQLFADRDQTALRLRQDAMTDKLPTMEELQQARKNRNETIDRVGEEASGGIISQQTVSRLRNEVMRADQLIDTIRMHGETVHRRAADQAKLDLLDEQIELQQATVETATEESSEAHEQWQSIWQAIDVVADTPARMQRWVADHQQLVECVAQCQLETNRLNKIDEQVTVACRRLHEVVATATCVAAPAPQGGGLFDREESRDDLTRLYDEAASLQRSLSESKSRYDQLCQKRDALKNDLPAAESRLQSSIGKTQQWDQRWEKVTAAFVDAADRSPDVVVSMLSKIDELCDQRRERNILATRIRSIGEDDQRYRDDVLRVAGSLGIKTDEIRQHDGDVSTVVQVLFDRLQHERSQASHRTSLGQQAEDARREISLARQQVDELDGMLAKLCEEADCTHVKELVEIERRAEQRRQFEASLEAVEDQLRILAGGSEIADFVDRTLEQDAGVLDVEIEKLESSERELSERIAAANQDLGGLRRDLQRIDGSAEASELRQSIQLLAGQISRHAQQYAQTKIAAMILREAIEHYRRENQGPVLGYAQEFFRGLTCGEYTTLRVDHDDDGSPVLLGIREAGLPDVHATHMSTGTADALYLSLRLASLKHQISHGQTVPLIVDDCLIQLDDRRAVAAIKAFSELSTQTQVILFTHHKHLIDLARNHLGEQEFHVHQLDELSIG